MRVFISASWNPVALEFPDLLPEGFPFFGIFHGGLISRLGNPQSLGGDADAPGIEHRHGDLKTLPFLAQALSGPGPVILEKDFTGSRSADSQLGFHFADREAGFAGIDEEGADAFLLLFRDPSS
jgi:hypothetical protein